MFQQASGGREVGILVARIGHQHRRRRHDAPDRKKIVGFHPRAIERQPKGDAVGHGLLADLLGPIASPEGDGAAHGLQVVAAPAATAVVDQEIGMAAAKLVIESQKAGDIVVLRDSLAVFRIVCFPGGQRSPTGVVPVTRDAFARDASVDKVRQPLPCRGVAEVDHRDVAVAGQWLFAWSGKGPFRVAAVFGPRRVVFRREPHDRLHAVLLRQIAHRSHAVRVSLRVGLPQLVVPPMPTVVDPPPVRG